MNHTKEENTAKFCWSILHQTRSARYSLEVRPYHTSHSVLSVQPVLTWFALPIITWPYIWKTNNRLCSPTLHFIMLIRPTCGGGKQLFERFATIPTSSSVIIPTWSAVFKWGWYGWIIIIYLKWKHIDMDIALLLSLCTCSGPGIWPVEFTSGDGGFSSQVSAVRASCWLVGETRKGKVGVQGVKSPSPPWNVPVMALNTFPMRGCDLLAHDWQMSIMLSWTPSQKKFDCEIMMAKNSQYHKPFLLIISQRAPSCKHFS